jgi:Tol biopolymer transport system component
MNRTGGVMPLVLEPNAYTSVRVSPDGKRLVYDTDDGSEAAVWVYDLSGANQPTRLTFEGRNRFPIWSSDSRRVAFQSDRDGSPELYLQEVNGGAAARLTFSEPGVVPVPEAWSPAEDRFSFSQVRGTSVSLWTYSVPDKHPSRVGNLESVAPFNSDFSPDGKWLAYTLRDGNRANIFVSPFPDNGDRRQITTANGHHPVWLPAEKALSYRVGNYDQVLVKIDTTSGFKFSNPTPAIVGPLPSLIGVRSFDITRDGRAFLVLAPVSANGSGIRPVEEMRIVQNWREELKQRVPTK